MPGVTPVALGSPERTAADLLDVLRRVKGTHDPGLEVSAVQAAELAHRRGVGLLAVVEHPDADPALLMAGVVPVDRPVDEDVGLTLDGPAIRDVTKGVTSTGYPVVIVERIPVSGTGAQLQVVVTDPAHPRVAVFTLHSPTGRGWLDVAAIAGRFVSGVRFSAPDFPGPDSSGLESSAPASPGPDFSGVAPRGAVFPGAEGAGFSGPGTRSASGRPPGGTSARSARR